MQSVRNNDINNLLKRVQSKFRAVYSRLMVLDNVSYAREQWTKLAKRAKLLPHDEKKWMLKFIQKQKPRKKNYEEEIEKVIERLNYDLGKIQNIIIELQNIKLSYNLQYGHFIRSVLESILRQLQISESQSKRDHQQLFKYQELFQRFMRSSEVDDDSEEFEQMMESQLQIIRFIAK